MSPENAICFFLLDWVDYSNVVLNRIKNFLASLVWQTGKCESKTCSSRLFLLRNKKKNIYARRGIIFGNIFLLFCK